ncbi:hypothetical protein PO878_13330 [Iamia majanohamensis]|uniref:Uncharacterized protein n=1 Tax=Iamia majanohamensis TaxID=467976 RepID=A0AAE9Y3P0_9ACTN|nr:hypothetical protein [Iamia majanohamensis]WCO65479.1 hypothetical protein PO878_13330 [Iamia majanohamensis]
MSLTGTLLSIGVFTLLFVTVQHVLVGGAARRLHADARTARVQRCGPTADHLALQDLVAEAVDLGYAVHDHGTVRLGGRTVAVTLLGHPDGSTIDATALPRRSGPLPCASVISVLADRVSLLETQERQGTLAGPHRLVEVLPGARLGDLVAQHRASRDWLAWRGIGTIVHPDGPVGVFEQSLHLTGTQAPPPPGEVHRLAQGRSVPNRGPLALQDGIEARLAGVGATSRPPTPPPAW